MKSIRSQYLGGGDPTARHCEIMLYLGVRPEKMTTSVLDRLVTGVEGRKMMPLPVRTVLRALNVTQFLQLRDVTRDPQRSRRPG